MNKLTTHIVSVLVYLVIVPFNYFFENNFNPMPFQFPLLIFCFFYLFNFRLKDSFLIIITFLLLLIISRFDLYNFFTSAIVVSFLFYAIVLVSSEHLKIEEYRLKKLVNTITILIVITLLYYGLIYIIGETSELRYKGFGSGTFFALASLYVIYFYYRKYRLKEIKASLFFILSLILIFSILITQSRGVFITLIVILLLSEFSSFRGFNFLRLLIIGGVITYFVFNSEIINRFQFTSYDSFDQFTSGRADSQFYILESFKNETNPEIIFFGNGLNNIKNVVYKSGYEFPHLDLLFILNEGGLVLIFLYLFTLFKIYKKFSNKLFFYIFLLSSFHTNMILFPGLLIYSFIADKTIN